MYLLVPLKRVLLEKLSELSGGSLTIPSNLRTSCLFVGVDMLNTASIFVGAGLRPSAEITWPMNVTSFFLSFTLFLFSLIPFSLQHCRRECSFLLLSATASLRATGAFLTGSLTDTMSLFTSRCSSS